MKLKNYSAVALLVIALGSGWCSAGLPSGYSVEPSRDESIFVIEIGRLASNLDKALLFNARVPDVWRYLEPADFGNVHTVFEGINGLYKSNVGDNSVRVEYRSIGQDYIYTLLDSLSQNIKNQIDAGLVSSDDMAILRKSMELVANYLLDRFPNVYVGLNTRFPAFRYSYQGLIQQICDLNPSDKMSSSALPLADDSKEASTPGSMALRVIAAEEEESLKATLVEIAQNAWNELEATGVDGVEETYKNYTKLFASMVNPFHESMIKMVNTTDFRLYTAAFEALLSSLKNKIEVMINGGFFQKKPDLLITLKSKIDAVDADLDGKLKRNTLEGSTRSYRIYFLPMLNNIKRLIRDEMKRLVV